MRTKFEASVNAGLLQTTVFICVELSCMDKVQAKACIVCEA